MNWLHELITNPILITSTSSWAIAQILKVIINAIVNKEWSLERLFGDGGMPSGHSATVSSLAVITGLTCGAGSVEFAIAAIVAIVVCHDAMGVRLESGKHAILLNEMLEWFDNLTKEKFTEVKLKEFVVHTPLQVIVGVLLGVSNAFLIHYVVFR